MYHNEQSSNDEVHTLVIVFYGICLDRRLCFRILSPKLERELPSDMKEASTLKRGSSFLIQCLSLMLRMCLSQTII